MNETAGQTGSRSAGAVPIYPAGAKVWRWWETIPGQQSDQQPLTIVRVRPKTYLVETQYGAQFSLPHRAVEGPWSDDEGGSSHPTPTAAQDPVQRLAEKREGRTAAVVVVEIDRILHSVLYEPLDAAEKVSGLRSLVTELTRVVGGNEPLFSLHVMETDDGQELIDGDGNVLGHTADGDRMTIGERAWWIASSYIQHECELSGYPVYEAIKEIDHASAWLHMLESHK